MESRDRDMEPLGRTSSEGEGSAAPSSRTSFSKLRSRLSSKKTNTTSQDTASTDTRYSTKRSSEPLRSSVASTTNTDAAVDNSTRSHDRTGSIGKHMRITSQDTSQVSSSKSAAAATNTASSTPLPPPRVPPKSLENPLSLQSPTIIKFYLASSLILVFVARWLHWSASVILAATLAYVLHSQLKSAALDAQWEKDERNRNIDALEGSPSETVEWMNTVLRTVWPLITQDYFVPFVDLLEDALMQQVPPIVHSCRVEDLDQGTVPLRIQSFVVLDSHEDAFTRGSTQVHDASMGDDDTEKDEDIPLDVGDFVNLEVTFAYRSPAARRKKGKTNKGPSVADQMGKDGEEESSEGIESDLPVDQIHLLIYMAIGLQKLAAVEVPVWCEMLGIEGKMRLRLQMVPTAPFVSHVAFCFVGMPKLEISAKPLGRRMIIDAMHLPLISSYVLHSVEAVVKDFLAPKSYTVNLAGLLGSGDGPSNVYSLGVIVVVIHQGIDLPAADANGLCDPFVSVAFARAGKTLFTTRIIVKSRAAIWQEMAVLLVSQDEVRDHEKLRLTVFDADRFSADDPLGKVEVSIDKLIHRAIGQKTEPGQPTLLESRTEDLQPMRKGAAPVKGRLKYSVGFFRLARPTEGQRSAAKQDLLRQAAKRQAKEGTSVEEIKEAEDKPLPDTPITATDASEGKKDGGEDLMECATSFDKFIHSIGLPLDEEVLRKRKERKARVTKLTTLMQGEQQATFGPPNRAFPSGILSFHIHSIDGLAFQETQKSLSNSKRLGQKPRYTADEDAMGENTTKMPNSYVQVLLNDEAVFRSRTKTLNPRPYINAGSERWVPDFETTRIDFIVRDQRLRENDPILGVAGIKLKDVLVDSSRSMQWYTLTGGLGWGKIRITLLWRSVEVSIPKQLSGWNLGVIEVAKCFIGGFPKNSFDRKEAHVMFETVGGRAETEGVEPHEEYESGEGEEAKIGFQWPLKEPVRIAVRQRYPNFLYIHLRSDSRVPGRVHKHAHSVISLSRIIDGEETTKRVPLFETSDWQQFEQDILRGITTTDQLASPVQVETIQQPILEDMCNATHKEYTDMPTDIAKEGHLKVVGYLDLTLIFHPGVSIEHKSLIPGDQEMRIAYESFLTLMDAGERPRPKMISAARRRKLSQASIVPPPTSADEDGMMMVEVDPDKLRVDTSITDRQASPSRSVESSGVPQGSTAIRKGDDGSRQVGDDEDDDEEDYDFNDDGEDFDDVNSPDGRRARARSLHRQHRGAAQVKGFRTLEWIKTNVEDGMGNIKRTAQQQRSKRIAKMESEGVSHF